MGTVIFTACESFPALMCARLSRSNVQGQQSKHLFCACRGWAYNISVRTRFTLLPASVKILSSVQPGFVLRRSILRQPQNAEAVPTESCLSPTREGSSNGVYRKDASYRTEVHDRFSALVFSCQRQEGCYILVKSNMVFSDGSLDQMFPKTPPMFGIWQNLPILGKPSVEKRSHPYPCAVARIHTVETRLGLKDCIPVVRADQLELGSCLGFYAVQYYSRRVL